MNAGRYTYNFEGLCEKLTYPLSLYKGGMITPMNALTKLVGNSPLYSLSLSVKRVK